MSKPDEWMDLNEFADVRSWIDAPDPTVAPWPRQKGATMSDADNARPPERAFRWKLAPLSGEWDAIFRVTLPKKNDEDDQEERDEK